jgi:hypothetical protein
MSARRRPSALLRSGVLAVTVLIAGACSIYNSSLLLPLSADGGNDAGDAGPALAEGGVVDAGGGDGDTCKHVEPPPRPTFEDGTPDAGLDVVVAVTYARLVLNGTATVNHPQAPVGVDLDGVCTCPGPPSCVTPVAQNGCDLDGGIDDNAGKLFASFAAVSPAHFSDDGLNVGVRSGDYTSIYRLKDYNGGKNDMQVTVMAYRSNGLDGHQDGGSDTPKYDGTDVWTIDPDSLLGGDTVDGGATCEGNSDCVPAAYDTNAYVSDGVLVAHIDAPIIAGGVTDQIRVELTQTVIISPIVFDGTYRVDEGRLAGRWNLSKMLTSLQGVADPFGDPGAGLCGDSGTYLNVKTNACHAADLMTDPTMDGKGAPCDALSIASSFSAVPAHLGPIWSGLPKQAFCGGASYHDDCTGVK